MSRKKRKAKWETEIDLQETQDRAACPKFNKTLMLQLHVY